MNHDFLQALQQYEDSELHCHPFRGKNCLQSPSEDTLSITTHFPAQAEIPRYREAVMQLAAQYQQHIRHIEFHHDITTHRVQAGLKPLPNVKNVIAVASGKGGVGKSTLSINLALALKKQGAAVGLLDADLYGPSQAKMLGGAQRPETPDGKTMTPILRHGLQTLSIGDLVEEDTAMIWRGPMVNQTLMQLLRETNWTALDYLIIDLPPGTGDTQLTLAQQIPVSGAIIITTPQDIALIDAKKAKTMFDKVSIPTLGIVENMSYYCCPQCGHQDAIFGEGGGKMLAEKYDLQLLGQIPLNGKIRAYSDAGTPIVDKEPDSEISRTYLTIAARLSATLSEHGKSFTQAFPKIVIER